MVFKGHAVGPLVRRTAREVLDDGLLGLAAQTAYYFFFSLFPLFLFLTPLLGVVGDQRETFAVLMGELSRAIPGDAYRFVSDVIRGVVFNPDAPGLMSVGALLALWSGSNIFGALMDALNKAYDVKDTRPWWKRRLIAIGCALVSGAILIAATVILIGGEDLVDAVSRRIGLDETGETVWKVVQVPLAVVMVVALAWAQYRILPNVRQNKWYAFTGAVLATALWIVVTLAFRFYVQNFGSYDKTYGTIGGIIVLLTWMYLSMLVLLIGGELAGELHHGTGAIDGRKGALLNGRIAAGGDPRASTDKVAAVTPITATSRDD
jgi:membrane protein